MTGTAACPQDAAGAIGPGRLVLVVGPSGAGKDAVLSGAKDACAGDASIVFARRVVTRTRNAHEDHDSLDPAHFDDALRRGAFALSWQAHGLRYGIPAAIDAVICAGRTVLCNASRSIVAPARRRYARVAVVLVTAPANVLAARLTARGRSSDGSFAERMDRNDLYREFAADIVIENVGALEDAVAALMDFLERLRVE
jgi:ribose 1,5-bisphosphokinase